MSGVIFSLATLFAFLFSWFLMVSRPCFTTYASFPIDLFGRAVVTATIISQTKSNVRTSLVLLLPARFLGQQMPSTKRACAADKNVQMVGELFLVVIFGTNATGHSKGSTSSLPCVPSSLEREEYDYTKGSRAGVVSRTLGNRQPIILD